MGKSKGGQAHFLRCQLVEFFGETIGSPHDKNQAFYPRQLLFVDPFGKAEGGKTFSFFVQQDNAVSGFKVFL